ncbi:MAG: ABC transporter substrate-binding protein [Gammaproteobacteria bacterium]|nr:ABC transporter substrate-binding protein [Gammaproteobacteria bacterium]
MNLFRGNNYMYYPFILFSYLLLSAICYAESLPINVALSLTPLSSPLIIAQEKGYFIEQKLQVKFNKVIGGNRAANQLNQGNVDMATSSEAVVMFNSFKNSNFCLLSTFVSSNNDVKILTLKKNGINTLDDLSDKRIGTILGASAHFFIDYTMKAYGANTENMTIINVNPEDTYKALLNNEVDVVVSWEPYIYLAIKQLGDKALIIKHEKLYNETFNLLANRSWAEKNQQQVIAFLKALDKAISFITANPKLSQKIVSTYLNKDLAIIEDSWDDLNFSLSLHQWLFYLLEAEADWAIKGNFVQSKIKPDYLKLFMIEPLQKIKPEAVTIISKQIN